MAVVDIGADYSSIWNPAGGVVSEPTTVAVDPAGTAQAFGLDAVLSQGRRGSQLAVARPFASGRIHDAAQAEAYVKWLGLKAGLSSFVNVPVFLPVNADYPFDAPLSDLVSALGGDPLVIHRATAASVALDVAAGAASTHLMVELCADAEVAVVRGGVVTHSELVKTRDMQLVASAVYRVLGEVNPYEEMEIRALGIHVYGWSAQHNAHSLASLVDFPVASPVGSGSTVLSGARLLAESTLPWLAGPPLPTGSRTP